jgi:hypothetical protein
MPFVRISLKSSRSQNARHGIAERLGRSLALPLRASGEVKAIGIPKGDRLAAEQGVRQEDVFINLVEVVRENWSFGNGIPQYADAPPPHLAKP